MENLNAVFIEPARAVLAQVGHFIGSLFIFILILIIGWLISKFVIQIGITKLLKLLKIDDLSRHIELNKLLAKGDINYTLSELVGIIFYWLSLLIFFVVALNAAGLVIAAELLERITLFIPNIIAAIFILIVGMFAAVIMKNIVKTAASNAGILQVNLLSRITEIIIIIFTIAMALEQLQIGAGIIQLSITVILGSIGLGFALAFGLGCKDIVCKSVTSFLDNFKK